MQNPKRLSDRIFYALELALEQGDVPIAEMLNQTLELSVTRNAGGHGFEERREYAEAYERAQQKLLKLKHLA